MSKIKLNFVDTWDACNLFFTEILSNRYDIEISNDPEFIIFGDETFGVNNRNINKNDVTKILFTGENRRPENYDCHYAITFDHNFNTWHYRLPLYVMDMWAIQSYHKIETHPYSYLFNRTQISANDKTDFCAFVHRNGGNPVRNNFFNKLNNIRKVNSAGPLLNNTGLNLPDVKSKIDYFSKHKFSLCFENSAHPGYVTEKILHGFYGNTIPIYWGSQTITKDFSHAAFINYYDFNTEEELIDKIIEIDNNDDEYNRIVNAPKFLYNIPNDCIILDNFLNWFDSVVYTKRFAK